MVVWLVGELAICLWLFGWLVSWPVVCGCLVGWSVVCGCLVGWWVGQLFVACIFRLLLVVRGTLQHN